MKNLDIEKAIIVGYSLGGMTALRFTLDYQDMVDKLILIDTTAKSSFSLGRKLLLSLSKILMDVSYRSFLKIYISRYSDLEDFDLEEAVARLLKTPKYVTKSCFSAIAGFDARAHMLFLDSWQTFCLSAQQGILLLCALKTNWVSPSK